MKGLPVGTFVITGSKKSICLRYDDKNKTPPKRVPVEDQSAARKPTQSEVRASCRTHDNEDSTEDDKARLQYKENALKHSGCQQQGLGRYGTGWGTAGQG